MLRLLGGCLLLAASTAAQQHGFDPFAGSSCTCQTFCDKTCDVKDVGGVQTLELYRMTQFGVVDMTSELVLANSTALLCDSVLGAVFLGLVLHA